MLSQKKNWMITTTLLTNFLVRTNVAMGYNMSLKIYFPQLHMDFFLDNLGDVINEHSERFHHKIFRLWKATIKGNRILT